MLRSRRATPRQIPVFRGYAEDNEVCFFAKYLILLVGAGRFELPTPSPPDSRGCDNPLF